MFFASKKVFANIDVTVARIQDSEDRERQNARHQNTLRVDTLQRKATNRETELTNDTPSFMKRDSVRGVERVVTLRELRAVNQNMFGPGESKQSTVPADPNDDR